MRIVNGSGSNNPAAHSLGRWPSVSRDAGTGVCVVGDTVQQVPELFRRSGPFATEGRRALHEQGWTDSLDRLEELITSREWFGRE